MRKELKKLNGERLRFSAKVARFGERTNYKGLPLETILLRDVRLIGTDAVLTDHLWFTKGKAWQTCKVGSYVEFDARVTTYEKGYKGRRADVLDSPVTTDYKLERPTKVLVKDGL